MTNPTREQPRNKVRSIAATLLLVVPLIYALTPHEAAADNPNSGDNPTANVEATSTPTPTATPTDPPVPTPTPDVCTAP